MTSRLVAYGGLLAGAAIISACAAPVAVEPQRHQQARAAPVSDQKICWITAVRTDPAGVRIHFSGAGGPLFVSRSEGDWAPDPAAPSAQNPDGPFLIAKLGDKLYPANSHHDSCELEIVKRDGRVGVQATASLHLPGLAPASASAFMPAVD